MLQHPPATFPTASLMYLWRWWTGRVTTGAAGCRVPGLAEPLIRVIRHPAHDAYPPSTVRQSATCRVMLLPLSAVQGTARKRMGRRPRAGSASLANVEEGSVTSRGPQLVQESVTVRTRGSLPAQSCVRVRGGD